MRKALSGIGLGCLVGLLLAGAVQLGAQSLPQMLGYGRTSGGVNVPLKVDSQGRLATSGGATGTVTSIATTSPITGGTITSTGTIACPTCGVTGSPLSQFASTTSAQLAGVISNETGSGLLVFGTGPVITLLNATGLPLTTGVNGNLPVTNLNSGASASSSTFWRGDGTWAAAGGSSLPAGWAWDTSALSGPSGGNIFLGGIAEPDLSCCDGPTVNGFSSIANGVIQSNWVSADASPYVELDGYVSGGTIASPTDAPSGAALYIYGNAYRSGAYETVGYMSLQTNGAGDGIAKLTANGSASAQILLDSSGSGLVTVNRAFKAVGYQSADGTAGATTTGFKNGLYVSAPGPAFVGILRGVTGSISGALTLGTCNTGTATVTGARAGMEVSASYDTNPGNLVTPPKAIITADDTITVTSCGLGVVTPTATTVQVAVIQ